MPLSAKQMSYLALAWQCFDSEPKIDYARLANIASLASAASARELVRQAKKKLFEDHLNSETASSPATPAKTGKAKAASKNSTPNKTTPKPRAKKSIKANKVYAGMDQGDGEGCDGVEDGFVGGKVGASTEGTKKRRAAATDVDEADYLASDGEAVQKSKKMKVQVKNEPGEEDEGEGEDWMDGLGIGEIEDAEMAF